MNASAHWKGPTYVKSALRERGYTLFDAYQLAAKRYCENRSLRSDIIEYFDEYSKEFVISKCATTPKVRSELIDTLSNGRGDDPIHLYYQMHPCFFCLASDDSFYASIVSMLEDVKKSEYYNAEIYLESWKDSKSAVRDMLRSFGKRQGFALSRGGREGQCKFIIEKELNKDLAMCAGLDFGGFDKVLQLSLGISGLLINTRTRKIVANFGDFRFVLPGFENYSFPKSPEAAAIGVRAMVDMCDVFCKSFLAEVD